MGHRKCGCKVAAGKAYYGSKCKEVISACHAKDFVPVALLSGFLNPQRQRNPPPQKFLEPLYEHYFGRNPNCGHNINLPNCEVVEVPQDSPVMLDHLKKFDYLKKFEK